MKVLYMTNIPAPYRVDFFNKLAKKCDLTVLFESKNSSERNEEWYKDNKYNFNYKILTRKKYLKTLMGVLKEKYDLVVIGCYATLPAAIARFYLKYKKIEYAISADGGFAEDKIFLTKWLKTFFISSATYWLSTGEGTSKYLISYGAKKENIYTFHFTSLNKEDIVTEPIPYLEKQKIRKKLNFDYDKIFVSVGQLVYRKGYDLFLDAIKENKWNNTAFIIAGVGEKMEEYQKYVEENHIQNVFFVGFKDKKEVLELYKMSDIFFFPTRYDIWGLVVNEAMACGLPVISTNKALASLELISDEYLYSPNDREKLAKLLTEFNNKEAASLYEIGKQNLETIKNYHIEQMVEDHLSIFKTIIKKINKK